MNLSFILKLVFLISALVIVGTFFEAPIPEPMTLNISTKDLKIEPATVDSPVATTTIKASKPASPAPAVSKPLVVETPNPIIIPPAPTSTPEIVLPPPPPTPTMPPLTEKDMDNILFAVARVRCGGTYGSGAVIRVENKRYVLTAAHVVIGRIAAGQANCDIIFPRKDDFGVFKEAHYRTGKILLPEQTKNQYQTLAHDIAILEVLPLPSEDVVVFPNGLPFVNYTFCPISTLLDDILLIGYPVNSGTTATPGGVISKFPGIVAQFSDIDGVEARADSQFPGGFAYYPLLKNTKDLNSYHPITVTASTNNFAGASGGLVFDLDKRCVLGINTATGVVNNVIYGISMNPAFPDIVNFLETAINQ